MKQRILYILALSVILVSCQKEITFDTVTGGGGGGGGGNANGSYQPTSKNSYWTYRATGAFPGDNTITSTGQKQTKNGIDYIVFNSTPATSTSTALMGYKNHNLYMSVTGASPNTGAPFDLNMLYLNDTASVGYVWDNTAGQGNGFTAYTPGIILEKNISMTVGGKNYNNVIHSQIAMQYEIPLFGTLTFLTYDYFVAKNVGIIRIITEGDPVLAPELIHRAT